MKIFYTFYLTLFFPLFSIAQSQIAYAYDAAGNRVKREIVMEPPKAKAKMSFGTEEQTFSDMLHEHIINISQNSASGFLNVNIVGLKGTDRCFFGIYTTYGTKILANNIETDNFDINISNQPNGIYLLRITINNSSTTWKIIKK